MSHNEIDISDEEINKAISLFERFCVIGFIDEMARFEREFEHFFEAPLALKSENTSPVRNDKKNALSEDILNQIKVLCEPNIRVYEALKQG